MNVVLRGKPADLSKLPLVDVCNLIRKLLAYQIELEMQNEELRKTQLEESRNEYFDLYDFAPVGYQWHSVHP